MDTVTVDIRDYRLEKCDVNKFCSLLQSTLARIIPAKYTLQLSFRIISNKISPSVCKYYFTQKLSSLGIHGKFRSFPSSWESLPMNLASILHVTLFTWNDVLLRKLLRNFLIFFLFFFRLQIHLSSKWAFRHSIVIANDMGSYSQLKVRKTQVIYILFQRRCLFKLRMISQGRLFTYLESLFEGLLFGHLDVYVWKLNCCFPWVSNCISSSTMW